MSAPYSTLLLDLDNWDLVLDSSANIAIAAPPYAVAQDVASALKTFLGEDWFDTTLGVPYRQKILGKSPSIEYFKSVMVAAALTVPTVKSAVCIIESFADRAVNGQVQFTTTSGQTGAVAI
jgi:hypothetical protein